MKKKQDTVTIYIEGNVGAGKSTFLSILKKYFDAQMIYEPHHLWQNVDGYNLLEQFFLDQKRWAFTLQTYVTMTRVDQLEQAATENRGEVQFVERSMYSGRYCFAQNAADMGLMNPLEWALYKKFWDWEEKEFKHKPSGFIYLKTPVQVCYQRIVSRGRGEEKPISLDYIEHLDRKHENWFVHGKGVSEELLQVPVLVLDNSQNLIENVNLQQKYAEKIKTFIQNIQKQ